MKASFNMPKIELKHPLLMAVQKKKNIYTHTCKHTHKFWRNQLYFWAHKINVEGLVRN